MGPAPDRPGFKVGRAGIPPRAPAGCRGLRGAGPVFR